jgi:hypothetical protein
VLEGTGYVLSLDYIISMVSGKELGVRRDWLCAVSGLYYLDGFRQGAGW